jgi:16S rRNA C1402 N4-methylase RsmH
MSPRPNARHSATEDGTGAGGNPKRAIDDRWNEQMTGVLRRAAEVRQARELARASDDERSARRETDALLALIERQATPRAGDDTSHPGRRTPAGESAVRTS